MKRVEIQKQTRLLDDFFKVDEAVLRFEKYDGEMSEPVRRLSLERGDAVGVLIYNRDTRRLIFVEQFRYPARANQGGWLVEVVAGMVDAGESPETSARREVLEETGYELEQLKSISSFYVSPGGTSEQVFLFLGIVSSQSKVAEGNGLAAEAEDIRVLEIDVPTTQQKLGDGDFVDAKTIIAIQWFLQNRPDDERAETRSV